MCSADRKDASQTTNTASGNCAADAAATACASAVLPTPPGPVTVVNGVSATLSITSASSRSLPTSPTRAQRHGAMAPVLGANLSVTGPAGGHARSLAGLPGPGKGGCPNGA